MANPSGAPGAGAPAAAAPAGFDASSAAYAAMMMGVDVATYQAQAAAFAAMLSGQDMSTPAVIGYVFALASAQLTGHVAGAAAAAVVVTAVSFTFIPSASPSLPSARLPSFHPPSVRSDCTHCGGRHGTE
jgi:hypothetical protein